MIKLLWQLVYPTLNLPEQETFKLMPGSCVAIDKMPSIHNFILWAVLIEIPASTNILRSLDYATEKRREKASVTWLIPPLPSRKHVICEN